MTDTHDVLIIGGAPAGLAAAVALARFRRHLLVVDAGEPRNAPADGVHNYLGREGTPPGELLRLGRAELAAVGGRLLDDRVVALRRDEADAAVLFRYETATGVTGAARLVLLATGAVDELPPIAGLRERYGRSVLHCPYCHGWEVRERQIVVLGTSAMSTHQALLVSQLSDDVVYLTHDGAPEASQRAQLEALGVRIETGRLAAVEGPGLEIERLVLDDGRALPAQALFAGPVTRPRDELARALGAAAVETPLGAWLQVDADGRTSVDGLWAAGNVADPSAQVIGSAAAGLRAGARMNAVLIEQRLAAVLG